MWLYAFLHLQPANGGLPACAQLAEKKWGVIGLQWRMVPCDYKPELQAPPVATPSPGEAPSPGAKKVNRGYYWQMSDDSQGVLSSWGEEELGVGKVTGVLELSGTRRRALLSLTPFDTDRQDALL